MCIRDRDNVIADTLSRYITEECEEVYETTNTEVQLLSIKYKINNETKQMLKDLAQQQNLDVTLREMKEREQLPDHYKVHNGVLFKLIKQDWKIVLTNKMLHKLIRPAHESLAHAAALKCYLSLREDFTINNMFRKIKNEVKRCYECQTAKGPNLHTYVEMQSIHKENKRELIAVDFLGPLPRSSRGVKHILVCIDVFSKAVRLYPIM